jgi:hypothetical protein
MMILRTSEIDFFVRTESVLNADEQLQMIHDAAVTRSSDGPN